MGIVYKGNYIRMTCGEIGLVAVFVGCFRRLPSNAGVALFEGGHIRYNNGILVEDGTLT